MWNRGSRTALVKHQDGRPGVVGGIDPVAQGQAVEFDQGSRPALKSQQGGDREQIEDRRKGDYQQCRQVVAAPGKTSLQVLQSPLGEPYLQDGRTGLPPGSSSGPVPQVSRYQAGILASLRKALLWNQGVGDPASTA